MKLSKHFDDRTTPPASTDESDAAALQQFFADYDLEKMIAAHTHERTNYPNLPPIRLFQLPEYAKASL